MNLILWVFLSVIDVPDRKFLDKLKHNKNLTNILDETKSTGIELIIHFTPDDVFKCKEYQDLINSINAKRQLVLNDSNK